MAKDDCGSMQPLQVPKGTTFEGYGWHSSIQEKHFRAIKEEFRILAIAIMKVPEDGCCDDEGITEKVTIHVSFLSHGLKLPFYRPLQDILDLLSLAPAQLHLFTLRAYVCACIVFRMVLEPLGNVYPNLTANEFLAFYSVKASKGEHAQLS